MPITDDQRAEGPPPPDTHARELGGAVAVVSGLTLVSRFGGLVRDVVTVRIFGETVEGSAFNAAFAVPNLFRRLLGEGALAAAFIPEYAGALRQSPANAARLASLTVGLLTVAAGAITVLGEAALLLLLWLLPHDPGRALSLRLIAVILPYMPLVCVTAILGGMLQVHGKFAAPAAGPVLLNLFIIGAAAVYFTLGLSERATAAYLIAAVTVAAGAAQTAWSLLLLRPHARWSRGVAAAIPAARRMLRRFVPAVVGAGTIQINALFDMAIAMWPVWVGPGWLLFRKLDGGSNSIIAYTQRLYQFPLGVFGIAVATAVFPLLARSAASPAHFGETFRRGLRLSFFIGLPASAGLLLVRDDLVTVLFSGGTSGFTAAGAARSAAILAGYAAGVWAYSLNHVFVRAFYASGDTATPMRVSVAQVGANLGLNLLLVWLLGERGLAWSTSLCASAQCVLLALLARRKLRVSLSDADAARSCIRTVVLTGVMAGAVLLELWAWGRPAHWPGHAARLAVACGTGGAVYVGLSIAARAPELRWLLRRG